MKKLLISMLAMLMVLLICVSCNKLTLMGISDAADTTTAATTTAATTTAATTNPAEPSGTPSTDSFLNGVELSNFSIVYASGDTDYNYRAAQYLQSAIKTRTDIELSLITDDNQTENGYEIIVGETNREISGRLDADTEHTQFAILAEDKQIALEGDYFIIAAAAYFFVETYVPEDNFSADIPKEVSIHEPIVEKANNYIVLIGDGMGLYQTLLFDVLNDRSGYSDGESQFYGYYLPYFGLARTNSLSGTTDSAASGTALATGYKTNNYYVGQNKDHRAVKSLTELAGSLGKATAVMSTEASTGATPSAFSAHANDRYDSADILADQQKLTADYGTIIKCNYDLYTATGIKTIERNITSTLNTLSEDEDGFFLMYEEAYIDKHCHNNDIANAFKAVIRFNQAIARFMEYAFYNPDTFVLITADHETGSLLPNSSGSYSYGSGNHSSQYVPVFAYGDGGELFDGLIIENVQIPQTIASFMGVTDFGDQSKIGRAHV